MNIDNPLLQDKHTLQQFDQKLMFLHSLLLEMTRSLIHQWSLIIRAMESGQLDPALEVVALANQMDRFQSDIDNEILTLLAKESPVANDLRNILSMSKIAMQLKMLGEEIAEIARMIIKLNRPRSRHSCKQLFSGVMKVPHLIASMLNNLSEVLSSGNALQAHLMLRDEFDCECELHAVAKQQLTAVDHDASQIGCVLQVLQILKAMESCDEYCKNIAECCIFMIERIDIRHQPSAGTAPA